MKIFKKEESTLRGVLLVFFSSSARDKYREEYNENYKEEAVVNFDLGFQD